MCLIKFNDELIRRFEYRISSANITALNRLYYKYFTKLFGLICWVTRQVNYVQLLGLENVLDSSFVNVPSSTWIFVSPISITNLVSFRERSIIINELYTCNLAVLLQLGLCIIGLDGPSSLSSNCRNRPMLGFEIMLVDHGWWSCMWMRMIMSMLMWIQATIAPF